MAEEDGNKVRKQKGLRLQIFSSCCTTAHAGAQVAFDVPVDVDSSACSRFTK